MKWFRLTILSVCGLFLVHTSNAQSTSQILSVENLEITSNSNKLGFVTYDLAAHPIIDHLRNSFTNASIPTLDYIKLHTPISCDWYYVYRYWVGPNIMTYNFRSNKGGILINDAPTPTSYIVTAAGLSGIQGAGAGTYISTIRVVSEELLIAEVAFSPDGFSPGSAFLPSLANPSYGANFYFLCKYSK